MTVSNELMVTILAMDSHNRGYNPAISDGEHLEDGLDLGFGDAIGVAIGNAHIVARVDSDPNGSAQLAGFYAALISGMARRSSPIAAPMKVWGNSC